MSRHTDVVFAVLGDPSGSSRALRQVRALHDAGVSVHVIGFGELRDPDALPKHVHVTELETPTGRGQSFFWHAHRRLSRALSQARASVFIASDLYVLPALARAARANRGKLVYDSRELYSALDSSSGRPLVSLGWGAVERAHIRRADAVLTVSDGIAIVLERRYGIRRPMVLPNVTSQEVPPSRTRALHDLLGIPDDGRLLVLYQGLFRPGRGLAPLLDAIRTTDVARVVLIGEGNLEADLRARTVELDNRGFLHPFIPPDDLVPLTASADLGACLIEPLTESLRLSLPNKLFEYLSAGTPVLASPLPEIRHVVERFDVGLLASPSDPNDIAAALLHASDPKRRARWSANAAEASTSYSWPPHAARFVHLIQDLIDPDGSPT